MVCCIRVQSVDVSETVLQQHEKRDPIPAATPERQQEIFNSKITQRKEARHVDVGVEVNNTVRWTHENNY